MSFLKSTKSLTERLDLLNKEMWLAPTTKVAFEIQRRMVILAGQNKTKIDFEYYFGEAIRYCYHIDIVTPEYDEQLKKYL